MNKSVGKKILSVLSTMLYVVLLALLVFALVANLGKKDNQIAGLFGYSFAVVQSGSMQAAGFDIGDMVIIKAVDTDTLKKGDIIVFYKYKDAADNAVLSYVEAHKITDEVETGTYVDKAEDDSALNRKTRDDAQKATNMLIFHRIIDIYVDPYGVRFFETKGDSNEVKDDILVREDFVCSQYVGTSPFVQGVLKFITSPVGLCVVIVLPILLTIGLQVFSFCGEVNGARVATRLLSRKMKAADVDFSKVKIAEYLSEPEKVYLYDISPQEDKLNLAIVLWDEDVLEAIKVYDEDRNKYYEHFFEKFKKGDDKKLEQLKIKADILKENPDIGEEDLDKKAKLVYKEQKELKAETSAGENETK